MTNYDAILLLSFGGPEGPDDVIAFLENVTSGRNVPRERLEIVADQYRLFGGVSPINAQNRDLISALEPALAKAGIDLPIWFGNRNWHPFLQDTVQAMRAAGHRRVLAIVTSAFGSQSGCRQYRDDIARATEGLDDIRIDKAPLYWNHAGFLDAVVDRTVDAMGELGDRAANSRLVFTAHSIPTAWTATAPYVSQLEAAAAHVAAKVDERLGRIAPGKEWDLVFQSRSGPAQVPWLEPDVNDHLRRLQAADVQSVCLVPLGFVSDHMEVAFDLDTQAAETAEELGMTLVRAHTAGTHPAFVDALVGLVTNAVDGGGVLIAIGEPWPAACPSGCCDVPSRPRETT
jgi:ferrochelatase